MYPVLTRINRVSGHNDLLDIGHNDEIVRVYPVLTILNRVWV